MRILRNKSYLRRIAPYILFGWMVMFGVVAVQASDDTEVIGDYELDASSGEAKKLPGKGKENGMHLGQIVMHGGILYGSSMVGAEFEFGVGKVVGLQVGGGFLGANAALNLHVFSRRHIDLFLSGEGNYMPALGAILPGLTFNVRGYFGEKARVGVGGKIGIAIVTVDRTMSAMGTTVRYRKGQPMLTYAIGVPFKVRQ